jgi:hypothetical protein
MAATGAGLCSQLGFAEEVTHGTFVAPARFLEFTKCELERSFGTQQSEGIYACGQYRRKLDYYRTTKTAAGSVEMEVRQRNMGLLFKHMLGAAPVITETSGGSGVWKHVYQPGALGGKSLSIQRGVPETASSFPVTALSYPGSKITGWTLGCKSGELLNLALDVDAVNESDAESLGTANYVLSEVFHFAQCDIKIGGTASTGSGVVSVASNTALARIAEFELKAENPMNTERYFANGAGVKSEQMENEFRGLELTLTGDFNKTQLYDTFKTGTPVPLVITFTGPVVASSVNAKLEIILACCQPHENTNPIDGPDVIEEKLVLLAEADGTNVPIQLTYTTLDTAM